ncbi:hypothetical protein V2J09_000405 [Rumex salicifolius]
MCCFCTAFSRLARLHKVLNSNRVHFPPPRILGELSHVADLEFEWKFGFTGASFSLNPLLYSSSHLSPEATNSSLSLWASKVGHSLFLLCSREPGPTADAKASSVFTPNRCHSNLSFALSPKPKVEFLSKVASGMRNNVITKAHLNKFFQDPCGAKSVKVDDDSSLQAVITKPATHTSSGELASQKTISKFITKVTNLVKLVDSRDIVELQMKQLDCEHLIRKKEGMTPLVSPSPAPVTPSPASPPSAPKPSKSSLHACSPAPGAPPFVKVGHKVQKGQVLCIVEAMKLMNEIEADQSGTIVEIVAEDTKPVSFDTALLGTQLVNKADNLRRIPSPRQIEEQLRQSKHIKWYKMSSRAFRAT